MKSQLNWAVVIRIGRQKHEFDAKGSEQVLNFLLFIHPCIVEENYTILLWQWVHEMQYIMLQCKQKHVSLNDDVLAFIRTAFIRCVVMKRISKSQCHRPCLGQRQLADKRLARHAWPTRIFAGHLFSQMHFIVTNKPKYLLQSPSSIHEKAYQPGYSDVQHAS